MIFFPVQRMATEMGTTSEEVTDDCRKILARTCLLDPLLHDPVLDDYQLHDRLLDDPFSGFIFQGTMPLKKYAPSTDPDLIRAARTILEELKRRSQKRG